MVHGLELVLEGGLGFWVAAPQLEVRGHLLDGALHYLSHSFVVDPAHDVPHQGEALDPVVGVGDDQLVAVEDGLADLLGGEDMVTNSVLEDVEQMLLLLTVAERENNVSLKLEV